MGDARIILHLEQQGLSAGFLDQRLDFLFRINAHAAELPYFVGFALLANAFALVEHRAAVLQLDGQGCG